MPDMRATRGVIITIALLSISFVSGCKKKSKQQVISPPELPALSQPIIQGATSPLAKTLPTPLPPSQNTTTQATNVPPQRPRSRQKTHKPTAKKSSDTNGVHGNTTLAQNTPPPKITIEQGSVPELNGIIIATMPHSDELHARLTTDQLLQSTDDNLRSIKRALTTDEQTVVGQIKNFISQARTATSESDFVRARNLALKAHLLSDELLRR